MHPNQTNSIFQGFQGLDKQWWILSNFKYFRDKTTINIQYNYHTAFWLLENSTILLAPNKWQIQIDWH